MNGTAHTVRVHVPDRLNLQFVFGQCQRFVFQKGLRLKFSFFFRLKSAMDEPVTRAWLEGELVNGVGDVIVCDMQGDRKSVV